MARRRLDANFGAVPSNWTILGDANSGILWRDTAGDIALWGVQNGQVTSATGLGTVTSNFVVQGVGDFNGDGKIDILWRDTNSGALSIWFTNGTQVTSAAVSARCRATGASRRSATTTATARATFCCSTAPATSRCG